VAAAGTTALAAPVAPVAPAAAAPDSEWMCRIRRRS